MYEGTRSPTIHLPTSLQEFDQITARFPDAKLWAGGTYIMSRQDYYPSDESPDIIYLDPMPELKRIARTDRYLEIGSMVSLEQLLSAGRAVLPEIFINCLSNTGTAIIRREATIGGALCTKDLRLALPCAMAILDISAEVRTKGKNGRPTSRWIPISKLYDRNGALILDKGALIVKLRFAISEGLPEFSSFYMIDKPVINPSKTVCFAFRAPFGGSSIASGRICCVYPDRGIYISQESDNILTGISAPVSPEKIAAACDRLKKLLKTRFPELDALRLEYSSRLLAKALQDMNNEIFAG